MTISDLLIISAASWYVSYSLTSSDGPFQMFNRLRNWHEGIWHGRSGAMGIIRNTTTGQEQPFGEIKKNGLLDCPLCLSIWVAAVFVLTPVGWLTYAFAAAGVSMWVHGYTGWKSYG